MTRLALPIAAGASLDALRAEPTGPETLRGAGVRIAIAFKDAADFNAKRALARDAAESSDPRMRDILAVRGVHIGDGPAPRVAFLYPGQGSQYPGMLRSLRALSLLAREAFDTADRVMHPALGRRLTDLIDDVSEVVLRATEIAQPAVLAADVALTRVLAEQGVRPDFALGHSLGEYAALVASGALSLEDAMAAIAVRGPEMARLEAQDRGLMASVFASPEVVEVTLRTVSGYVVAANKNSRSQTVIAGDTAAVEAAVARFRERGVDAVTIPVSHAFHTALVAPAAEPLARALGRLTVRAPRFPVVSSVTGMEWPSAPAEIVALLARQVACPVEFVRGLERLWDLGARLFVEVGPSRALTAFALDVLGGRGARALYTNHPRKPDVHGLAECVAALWAAGIGID